MIGMKIQRQLEVLSERLDQLVHISAQHLLRFVPSQLRQGMLYWKKNRSRTFQKPDTNRTALPWEGFQLERCFDGIGLRSS